MYPKGPQGEGLWTDRLHGTPSSREATEEEHER